MKKLNKITFNHTTKEIIITKAFETEANVIGSSAYNELVRIRKDFPDYTIKRKEIAKKENKKSFKGLTVKEMKRFLATVGKKDLELFEKVCKIAEGKQGKYAVIKKWFLNNYQDAYEQELENLKVKEEESALEKELAEIEAEVTENEDLEEEPEAEELAEVA